MSSITIGQSIRKHRIEAGLTILELSLLANITESYLCRLENDLYTPKLIVCIDLANALGVSIDELISFKRGEKMFIRKYSLNESSSMLGTTYQKLRLRLIKLNMYNQEYGKVFKLTMDQIEQLKPYFKENNND